MQENKGYYNGLTSPGWTGSGLYVGEDCYIELDVDILRAYDADGNDVGSWVDLSPSKNASTAEWFWKLHGGTIQKAANSGEPPEIQLPENTNLGVGPEDFGGSDFPDGFESGWERQIREARDLPPVPTWEDTARDVVQAMGQGLGLSGEATAERLGREFAERPLQTDFAPAEPLPRKTVHVVHMPGVFGTYFAGNGRGVSDPDEAKKYASRADALADLSWQQNGQDKAEIKEIEDRKPSGECGTCGGGGGSNCPECHPTPAPDCMDCGKTPCACVGGIYVASRASVPERPAMWRAFRDAGYPIISSWIDEAGPGETASHLDLWRRIRQEIQRSDALILYIERSDLPVRGAFVEVGMALALGKPVFVASPGVTVPDVGSWQWAGGVTLCADVEDALRQANARVAARGFEAPMSTALESTEAHGERLGFLRGIRQASLYLSGYAAVCTDNAAQVALRACSQSIREMASAVPPKPDTDEDPLLFAYVAYRDVGDWITSDMIPVSLDIAKGLKAGADPRILLADWLREADIPADAICSVSVELEDPGNTSDTTAETVWTAPGVIDLRTLVREALKQRALDPNLPEYTGQDDETRRKALQLVIDGIDGGSPDAVRYIEYVAEAATRIVFLSMEGPPLTFWYVDPQGVGAQRTVRPRRFFWDLSTMHYPTPGWAILGSDVDRGEECTFRLGRMGPSPAREWYVGEQGGWREWLWATPAEYEARYDMTWTRVGDDDARVRYEHAHPLDPPREPE